MNLMKCENDDDSMNEICHHLGCQFYRYNENKGELNEYTNKTTE